MDINQQVILLRRETDQTCHNTAANFPTTPGRASRTFVFKSDDGSVVHEYYIFSRAEVDPEMHDFDSWALCLNPAFL